MIVTPAAATDPVEQSASTSARKRQRNRLLNAEVTFTIADGCTRRAEENREKTEQRRMDKISPEGYSRCRRGHPSAYRFRIMKHPDDEGQPTFLPENTRELNVGENIENGDLKWHQSAHKWAEIQTLGYRTVKASQKGLFRRYAK